VGLRERKAEKARQTIIAEGMRLFTANGYDETTIESIAEASELSPSTVYRYFPSKDLIALSSFESALDRLMVELDWHPAADPLEPSLAAAISRALAIEDQDPDRARLVRSIVDQSPAARARLWEHLAEAQKKLQGFLGRRLELPPDDLRVLVAARLTITIVEIAADVWRSSDGSRSSSSIAEEVAQLIRSGSVVIPAPTAEERPRDA
jgi:AcrR family transcriptional regulator